MSTFKELLVWIPPRMPADSVTRSISDYMMSVSDIKPINTDEYENDFGFFYKLYMKNGKTKTKSFCSTNNKGVSISYIIDNANDKKFLTILSVETDADGNIYTVYAAIIFRWSEKADAVKVQVLCGNQMIKGSGEGTRLLSLLKTTLKQMKIKRIYLNPLSDAVPYYYKHQFRTTQNKTGRIIDTSDDSPESSSSGSSSSKRSSSGSSSFGSSSSGSSSSRSSSSKRSSSRSSSNHPPAMLINFDARDNWAKLKQSIKVKNMTKKMRNYISPSTTKKGKLVVRMIGQPKTKKKGIPIIPGQSFNK